MAILKVKDTNGNEIPIPAIRGKSAYQYAKEGGYTGTEDEFKAKMAAEWASKEDVEKLEGKKVDGVGIKSIVKKTQAEYDAMASHDSNTIYVIEG